jgi:hypothetical protein
MNIVDILDGAFGTVEPGPAPIEAAVKKGRALRLRRRLVSAASVAALVAAAVSVPVVLHRSAAPAPTTGPGGYSVTVQPPGPHSPAGLVASGTVNGKAWRVTAVRSTETSYPALDFSGRGPAFGPSGLAKIFFVSTATYPGRPINFLHNLLPPAQLQVGIVGDGVTYATVRFGNGIVLTLHPATVLGIRVVAFAAPLGVGITGVTAYSSRGEAGTAIPLILPGQDADFISWLRPGQRVPASAGGLVASGRAEGHAWAVYGYSGPWGTCAVWDEVPQCLLLGETVRTSFLAGDQLGRTTVEILFGVAEPDVTRLVAFLPGGRTAQTRAVLIGTQKFFAFGGLPVAQNFDWAAYDAAGKRVAHGTF